jgi:peptidoglycan/xylan/chitin deacetylase (PgdA/CDA1 family)
MGMKKRFRKALSHIKRGVTSLFVCAAVILPAATMVEWSHAFGSEPKAVVKDTRPTNTLPKINTRQIDDTNTPPNLFGEALITVTFDDGWESVYTQAMPLLNKYGIRTTQYIIADTGKDFNYISDFQIREMLRTGHELDSHTFTHADLPTKNDKDLKHELLDSQKNLQSRFGSKMFDDLASPYGHTDDRVMQLLQTIYRSHRNTDGDYYNGVSEFDVNVAGNFDRYNIIGVTIRHDTTADDLKKLVDFAIANNGWLVLTYHAVDDEDSAFAVDNAAMESQLKYLSSVKARIVTMGQVLDTIAPTHQEY